MNREVTLRQVAFMYLFISLSPIIRQIPSAVADEAGRSGYISPLWSIIAILPLTAVIIILLKAFPGLNFYEIMVQLVGKFVAKIIIFAYLLWIFIAVTAKVNIYALTLQFTLMPQTRSNFFMVVLIILVYYALIRGVKTIFRFSEFTLGTILLLFTVLFLFALSRLRMDYLLPVSTINIVSTISASRNVIAVGGNIILALFFADKYGISITKDQFRKLWFGAIVFIVLAFVITIFTYGITGAGLAANLPFPFYITVKSISIFNIFERFEVFITIICVLSDFIAVCLLSIMLLRCFKWLFNLSDYKFLYIPITVIIYYFTYYLSSTQFEFDFLYKYIIVNLNLVFQYIFPFILVFITFLKRKRIKKPF